MNRKLKFIIFAGIITSVFMGSSAFLAFKLVCSSNGELNPKENVQSKIKTFKSKKENKINVEIKKENKNSGKLKKFQSDDNNNVNIKANTSNERRGGDFYIDNINDFYNNKLLSLDEMFWVQKRLKEIAEDMPRLYKETLNIKESDEALKKYMAKGENEDKFKYVYGIRDAAELKNFINKLDFLSYKEKVVQGVVRNIVKKDDNNVKFVLDMYSSSGNKQHFDVSLEFKNNGAVLDIKIQ